jgi:hypothetical protein
LKLKIQKYSLGLFFLLLSQPSYAGKQPGHTTKAASTRPQLHHQVVHKTPSTFARIRNSIVKLNPFKKNKNPGEHQITMANGAKETRRGKIPQGFDMLKELTKVPPQGVYEMSFNSGALNLNVFAKGSEQRGFVSDFITQRANTMRAGSKIQRVNVYDIVNQPTLKEMTRGLPFLESKGAGRTVQRVLDSLNLKTKSVVVEGTGPKLNIYIQVEPK